MTTATTTTDHSAIRKWVEARKGQPSRVKGAKQGGILRIDFESRKRTWKRSPGTNSSPFSMKTSWPFFIRTRPRMGQAGSTNSSVENDWLTSSNRPCCHLYVRQELRRAGDAPDRIADVVGD